MKKLIVVLTIFVFLPKSYGQCGSDPNDDICRGALAGLIFQELYENDTNPYNYPAAYFPSPYIDMQDPNPLYLQLKILSYLQYDDNMTASGFTLQPSYCYKPEEEITRIEATVLIMEAWDIPPNYSGSSPFDDIDEDDPIFGYAHRAYDEGFIDAPGDDFDPYDPMEVSDAVNFVFEVLNSQYHPVSENLYDIDNYFVPGIYSPNNLYQLRGVNQGVFNHYAKNSFRIPDIKVSLDFSHFYSTTMVEMPTGFYRFKPLGTGWSHTYNSYIIREDNVGLSSTDYYFIVWPDGTIHTYNEDDDEYESIGVYDELEELSGGDRIRIRKKDQTDFYFEQLDNSEDIWYLVEIEDPNSNEINIFYETSDVDNDLRRINYVESESDKRLTFEYVNNTDYLERITDPIGREILFDVDHDDDERLEEFTDAKGNITEYNYIENNANSPLEDQRFRFLLDEIILPRGNKITAEFDEDDMKLSSYRIDGDNPIEIELDYDYFNQEESATITSPVAGGSDFIENFEFNINGLVTNYEGPTDELTIEYPSNGPHLALPTETDFNGLDIEYEYDSRGNVEEINVENGSIVEEFDYDSDNNLIEYIDPNGNVTTFDYDSDENLIEISDALGNSITFTYDSHGQLLSKTNQEGITINYTYENDGAVSSVTMPEGIEYNFTHDGVNRMLSSDRNGLVSSYSYDPNDNLTSTTDSGGFVTSFDYDANDNLIEITNANNVTTSFSYDDEDRVIQEQYGSLIKSYEYGDEGYLESYTKPSGDMVQYDYDNEGRLEETGTITDIDYNDDGFVWRIYNDNGHYIFSYNNVNRLELVEDKFHFNDVEYEYDDAGNIVEIDYPDDISDIKVFYEYDDKNRMTRVEAEVDGSVTTIAEYEYRDDDLLDEVEYGNDVRTRIYYDDAGRKYRIKHSIVTGSNTSTPIFDEQVQLDTRGNILSSYRYYLDEEVPIDPDDLNVIDYTYDQNNHLTSANGLPVEVNDDGNTDSREVSLNGTTANINYNYDIDDRLVSINAPGVAYYPVTYEYDVYGNRVTKLDGSSDYTYYTWDLINNNVIVEESNTSPDIYHIYGATGLEASIVDTTGEVLYYYLGDIRGSVVVTIEEENTNYFFNKYDDFGNLKQGQFGATPQGRFKYLGKYGITLEQPQLGHYYIKARHYDADLGRFLTEDPIWSNNLYPYALNNPIKLTDINGQSAFSQTGIENFFVASYLTLEFIAGNGQNRVFNENQISRALQDADVTNQARNYWYDQVNSGNKTINSGLTNFRGEKRLRGNFGLKGLYLAGSDSVEQFVGSFTPDIHSDGETLYYSIYNTSSLNSLLYGLIPDRLGQQILPNASQVYLFSEPIDFNRIRN